MNKRPHAHKDNCASNSALIQRLGAIIAELRDDLVTSANSNYGSVHCHQQNALMPSKIHYHACDGIDLSVNANQVQPLGLELVPDDAEITQWVSHHFNEKMQNQSWEEAVFEILKACSLSKGIANTEITEYTESKEHPEFENAGYSTGQQLKKQELKACSKFAKLAIEQLRCSTQYSSIWAH